MQIYQTITDLTLTGGRYNETTYIDLPDTLKGQYVVGGNISVYPDLIDVMARFNLIGLYAEFELAAGGAGDFDPCSGNLLDKPSFMLPEAVRLPDSGLKRLRVKLVFAELSPNEGVYIRFSVQYTRDKVLSMLSDQIQAG